MYDYPALTFRLPARFGLDLRPTLTFVGVGVENLLSMLLGNMTFEKGLARCAGFAT